MNPKLEQTLIKTTNKDESQKNIQKDFPINHDEKIHKVHSIINPDSNLELIEHRSNVKDLNEKENLNKEEKDEIKEPLLKIEDKKEVKISKIESSILHINNPYIDHTRNVISGIKKNQEIVSPPNNGESLNKMESVENDYPKIKFTLICNDEHRTETSININYQGILKSTRIDGYTYFGSGPVK